MDEFLKDFLRHLWCNTPLISLLHPSVSLLQYRHCKHLVCTININMLQLSAPKPLFVPFFLPQPSRSYAWLKLTDRRNFHQRISKSTYLSWGPEFSVWFESWHLFFDVSEEIQCLHVPKWTYSLHSQHWFSASVHYLRERQCHQSSHSTRNQGVDPCLYLQSVSKHCQFH